MNIATRHAGIDSSRMTGKPEVIPADPIRTITSGLPTIRDLIGSANTTTFLIANWV